MKHDILTDVDQAMTSFLEIVEPLARTVIVPLEDADNRVLSKDVIARMDYPHYDQCILDGYAIRAADTIGCGEEGSSRVLRVVTGDYVASGSCMVVHTGSMLPSGADALLPLESATEKANGILALKEVAKGEWIWPKGGGVRKEDTVNREGMYLKPTDIAMLAKLGISHVDVYDRPRVLIVPTGDECIKRGEEIAPGFVYETNGLMCCFLVKRYGGIPILYDIMPDNKEKLIEVMREGLEFDLVVTIGGSSASGRDLMEEVVSSAGEVLFHGVSFHPGNHMGAGFVSNGRKRTPVIFLPGYTESCAVAAFMFVDPAVKKLGHYPPSLHGKERVQLAEKVTTPAGIRAIRKVNIQNGMAKQIKMIGESSEAGKYAYIIVQEGIKAVEIGETIESVCLE
jgi:molybdopterin molybdotransferase